MTLSLEDRIRAAIALYTVDERRAAFNKAVEMSERDQEQYYEAEIERLRAELAKAHADALIANMRYVEGYNNTIEECVRRIISWSVPRGYNMDVAEELAHALRALKDKP